MNKWIVTLCVLMLTIGAVFFRTHARSLFTLHTNTIDSRTPPSLRMVEKESETLSQQESGTSSIESLSDSSSVLQDFLAPPSHNTNTSGGTDNIQNKESSIQGSTPTVTQQCPTDNTLLLSPFLFPLSKTFSIDTHYIPDELVQVPSAMVKNKGFICVTKTTLEALERMFGDAKKEGYMLYITSGFRSGKTQASLFSYYVNLLGTTEATRRSAESGHSEHQLGTTVDITGGITPPTNHYFGETPEGTWLQEHAAEYGFVMSYEKDKESITGYMYEPWHFRYVGYDIAHAVIDKKTTIGEFLLYLYINKI